MIPIADLRLNIQANTRQPRTQIQQLQQEVQNLRGQLGQTQRTADTAGDQVEQMGRQSRQASEAVDTLGDQSRQSAAQMRGLGESAERAGRNTTGLMRSIGGASGGTQTFTRSLGGLSTVIGGLGIAVVGAQVLEFGRGSVTAATRVEGFRNGLTALYGDAEIAGMVLEDLSDLSQLPGITFDSAVQGAIRLKTVGIEGDRANSVIREFGNAAALAGQGGEEMARAFVGLSQAISRGRIDQENLNQILENVPLIGNAIRESFNTIDAQVIQQQLDAAGQSVQDFVDIVVNQLGQGPRASADSTANAFSNLGNAVFRLQAEVGEQFLPIVRDATVGLTNFLDTLRGGITDVNSLPEPLQDIVEGAQSLYTALEEVARTIAANIGPQIQELLPALGALLGNILELAGAILNALRPAYDIWSQVQALVINLITDLAGALGFLIGEVTSFINWITGASDAQDEFRRMTEGAMAAVNEGASSTEQYRQRLADLQGQLESTNARIADYEERLRKAKETAVGETNPSIQQLERRLAEAQVQATGLQSEIDKLTGSLEGTKPASDAASESTENFSLRLAQLQARAEDVRADLENVVNADNIQASFQSAIEASDAYYDAQIENARTALERTKAGSEERQRLETEIFELERDREQARQALIEEGADLETDIAQRRADARIQAAERVRAVEVSGFMSAAASGQEYAAQLERLSTLSDRRAFSEIVEQLQDQGLSFDEALRAAEPYIGILSAISPVLTGADAAFGEFSATLVRESDRSADAVANLLSGVQALADFIGTELPDTAGSLERSLLNEQRYFEQNRGGQTLESIRQDAGQQGRDFVGGLFQRQDRDADREAREAERVLQERTDNIVTSIHIITDALGDLDGSFGEFSSILQSIDFSNLLSGNPIQTIAEIGMLFVDLFNDVRDRRQEILRDRAATAALVGRVRINAINDENIRAAAQGRGAAAQAIIGESSTLNQDQQQLVSNVFRQITDAISLQDISVNREDLLRTYQPFIDSFQRAMTFAGERFELAIDRGSPIELVTRRFDDFVENITDTYDTQIEAIQAADALSGNESRTAIFELIRERDGLITDATNQLREIAAQRNFQGNFQAISRQQGRLADARAAADTTVSPEYAQYQAAVTAAEVDTEALNAAIESINEDVGLINASITSVETQIGQASEPAEIAELLSQIPDLIREKYRRLRESLDARYNANEISVDVYNASLSELESGESAEIERNSDAMLANVVRMIDEDIQLLDASITEINTQIAGISEPEAIAVLLDQVPALTTEKYRRLREALDARYAAGEISVDVYNASLTQLSTDESAAIEQNSDAVLANALLINQQQIESISTGISGLENAISQSNDPAEIAQLLQQIGEQIPEIYRLRREALQSQFAAGEITRQALETGIANLNIAESAAVEQNSDAQLANTLTINQQQTETINTAISDLENRISQSNDPSEIESLLQQIGEQIPEIYRLRREALQSQFAAGEIIRQALETGIANLNIAESAAVEQNSDAVLANTLLINQQQIESISTGISGLENAISQSNDPAEIANLLTQIAVQIPEIYRLRREALQAQYDADEITLSALNTGISQLNIAESAALEQNSDEQLANTLLRNSQAVEAVSVFVSELENRISQSNDPAEIARLLIGIAEQIPEIYSLRRNALSKQLEAGEITRSAFNTGIANLNIEESAALEQNSDTLLANALLVNQQAIDMLSAGVSSLENAISQSNDLVEIERLLMDIAEQIPEIYRLRREALQAQYDAGEITLSALNTGLAIIDTEQSAAVERNSDTQLANTLRINQEAVDSLNAGVADLENAISQSNDPLEIESLLQQIGEQIPEIYRLRREALQSQFAAGEITRQALETGIANLNIAESAAVEQNSDAVLANTLLINQQASEVISANIAGLENSISQSNDPAEIAQLLIDIAEQIPEIYRLRREALQSQFAAGEITRQALETGIANLNIAESAAVEQNSDQMLTNALRINQQAVDAFSTEISTLENTIIQSNDLVEIQTLLTQIAEQIPEIYGLRREALQAQFDAGEITKQALETGIANLNIEESAALEQNSDQQLANALLINQQAVDVLSSNVSALENQITQSNDPTETGSLLQQIGEQIPEIYRLRREALQSQFAAGEITRQALETGIANLNIAESAAVEQNSDQILANALLINQQAIEVINVEVSGLENAISQSNDPAEIAQLLQQIAIQIPEIYRLRREALQAQYDAGEITLAALESGIASLNIEASAALEQNSDEQLANTLGILNENAQLIDTEINTLSQQIQDSTAPAEIAQLVIDLQSAITEKYRLQREVLQQQLDAEEITIGAFNAQLGNINLTETGELASAAALGGAETDDLSRASNALLQNAIQRAEFNLSGATSESDFESRRQELIRFTNEFYDAEEQRISQLMGSEAELQNLREDNQLAREQGVQRLSELENTFTQERIQNAERENQLLSELQQNRVQRAQFELGQATDEADFESRRQTLIDATNRYYDLEEARIETLEGSEAELQNLREDNQLAREQGVQRLSELENTFTQERIQNAEDVAEAEAVAAEERERQLQRERELISELQQNRVQRAQFELGQSTDEGSFESRRQTLIDATNRYYDLEEARIETLEGSEAELQNLREDNQLAREQAIHRALSSTNQFAQERIAEEERVQAELLRLEEERAREIDSVHAAIATEEANRLEALQDLQERHNDRLIELEENLQDRLFDLRERAADRLEDLNREQARSLEDLNTDFARRLFGGDVVSAEDLTARQREQLETDPEYQRALFDLNRRGSRQREDFEVDFGTLTDPNARDALINEIRSGQRTLDPEAEGLLGRESSGALRGFLEELRDTQIDFVRTQQDIQLEGQIELANLQATLNELFSTRIGLPQDPEREQEGFGFEGADTEREQERAELQQETAQLERETIDFQRELMDLHRENIVQETGLLEQQHALVAFERESAALMNANALRETALLESQGGLVALEFETAQLFSQTAGLESRTAQLSFQTASLESQTAALESRTAQFESIVVQRDFENALYFRAVNDIFLQGSQHLLVAAATLLNAASLSQSAAIATQAAAETPSTVNFNIDTTEIGDAVVQAQDEGTVLASPSAFTDA